MQDDQIKEQQPPAESRPHKIMIELERLIDLAVKYPEIGAPLAELCFKIDQRPAGDRLVKMGLDQGARGLEFFLVAANNARREGRHGEARQLTVDAIKAFAAAAPESTSADDAERLMHLIRIGFSTLLFDQKDPHADPAFVAGLREHFLTLEARLGTLPFFHVLVAQTRWYDDKAAAEASWTRAGEIGDDEHTWNAHGTWLKDAEHDYVKAEEAYRRGLEKAPKSALLRHNIAQVLIERAAVPGTSPEEARKLCNRADEQLRFALREDGPKGLRRHVHSTRDRMNELRNALPALPRRERPAHGGGQQHHGRDAQAEGGAPAADAGPPPPPEKELAVGDVVTGKVQSLTDYGAFVQIGRRVGLLHKTEMAYEFIADPATILAPGQEVEVKVLDVQQGERGRQRIGLSRKALLPPPPGGVQQQHGGPRRGDEGGGQQHRGGGGGQQQQRGGGGQQPRGGGGGGGPRRDDHRNDQRGGGGDQRHAGGGGSTGDQRKNQRNDQGNDQRNAPNPNRPPEQRFLIDGKVSLGDLLMAKLREQGQK